MNYTFASATILLILITDPIGNIPLFANALKHAGATQIRVSVGLREGAGLRVEIADNGAGFKPQARSPQHGRGLFNMSQRALRLSGVLNVDSSADGTLVRLDLPAATTV